MKRFERFFLAPSEAYPLAFLRIALSAVLLVQAFWLAGDITLLFGNRGLLPSGLNDFLTFPLGYSEQVLALSRWLALAGTDPTQGIRVLFAVYCFGLGFLLVGLYTRMAAIVTCLLHFYIVTTGYFASYGADRFAQIALFYLAVFPCAARWSLDERLGRIHGGPSWMATLGLRVLQFHLCIAYLATAVEKSFGSEWHDGEAIWRALMLPRYGRYDFQWLARAPWVTTLLAWATLVVEGGYALFMWIPRTRKFWVALTVGLHLGIAVFMGLVSFSLAMAALTLAAFGIPEGLKGCTSSGRLPTLNRRNRSVQAT